MACGGCGKRKAPNKIIIRQSGRGVCPTCGSDLRYVHKLDRSTGKMRKQVICANARCTYKG